MRYGHFSNKQKILNFSQKKHFFKQKTKKSKFFTKNIFLKQMTAACSIYTLDGWVQLFWAAFDLPVKGVQLKVALEYNFFWLFQKA